MGKTRRKEANGYFPNRETEYSGLCGEEGEIAVTDYPKNIKKISIGKRILVSWFIIALIFFSMGYGSAVIILGLW